MLFLLGSSMRTTVNYLTFSETSWGLNIILRMVATIMCKAQLSGRTES